MLEQIGEELNRFLGHRAAQAGERGEMPVALFVEMLEVVDLQPVAGELGGKPARFRIAQHASRLGGEHFGLVESAVGRQLSQFVVGLR